MTRYRIKIADQSKEAMVNLVRKYKIHILNHGISHSKETCYTIEAITDPDEVQPLEDRIKWARTVSIIKSKVFLLNPLFCLCKM